MTFNRKDKLNDHWRRKHAKNSSQLNVLTKRRDDSGEGGDFDGPNMGGFFGGVETLQGGQFSQASESGMDSTNFGSSGFEQSFSLPIRLY
jgi:hypothetical protein